MMSVYLRNYIYYLLIFHIPLLTLEWLDQKVYRVAVSQWYKLLHIALSSICTESQYTNGVGIVVAV